MHSFTSLPTKGIYLSLLLLIGLSSCSHKMGIDVNPSTEGDAALTAWQQEQNKDFHNPDKSPLTPEDRDNFKGLEFYPYDSNFKVIAQLERTPDTPIFDMKTTSTRTKKYRQYGIVKFKIGSEPLQLNVYQSQDLMDSPEFRNYLFLPFYDATTGQGSYGGGRYISLTIPEGDRMTIDFNEAYNPYCAYSDGYSCPITPLANNLQNVKILAGTKDFEKH